MGSRERERKREGERVGNREAYSEMKETYEMPGHDYEPLTPSPGSRSGHNQSRSRSLDKQMIRVKVAGPVLQTPATLLTSIHNTN